MNVVFGFSPFTSFPPNFSSHPFFLFRWSCGTSTRWPVSHLWCLWMQLRGKWCVEMVYWWSEMTPKVRLAAYSSLHTHKHTHPYIHTLLVWYILLIYFYSLTLSSLTSVLFSTWLTLTPTTNHSTLKISLCNEVIGRHLRVMRTEEHKSVSHTLCLSYQCKPEFLNMTRQ